MRDLTAEEKKLFELEPMAQDVYPIYPHPLFMNYMFPIPNKYVRVPRGKGRPKHFNKKRHGRMLRRKHGRAVK